MTTTKQIFNYIQGMNASTSTVSSIGTFVTSFQQQVADSAVSETIQVLVNDDKKETLAFKIASSNSRFSEKQLWVIAFELEKNAEFANKVASFYNELDRKTNAKMQASKDKLTANKSASVDVLAPIKLVKRIVEFGKWLNTSGNQFRKEHFSKKYTHASVNAFLSI